MTIRIYPSRLPGEPLEKHEHRVTTIHNWMKLNVEGYKPGIKHPITIEVDGEYIPSAAWFDYAIKPESDVRIYPVPYTTVVVAWVAIAVSVASVAYALFFAPGVGDLGGYSSGTGNALDVNPAKANNAKLGDPIRELFGRSRIYPDYAVQPVTRFSPDDPTVMTVEMFVVLGMGYFSFGDGDVRVGSTPVSSLGDGFAYTVFQPGQNVAGYRHSENWFNSTEVGGTASGSGLDMAQTAPDTEDVVAESLTVSGSTITFNGLSTDDGDTETNDLPDSWTEGAIVELIVPDSYVVTNDGAYSRITSDVLGEIAPYVGMPVTLWYNSIDYQLFIADYTPHSEPPGEDVITSSITLAYESATGTAFTGIPEGYIRLSVSHAGSEYKILEIDASSVTLQRVVDGIVDPSWPGFSSRTVLDFEANGLNENDTWMGPFLACPENEVVDMFEVNFFFPNGICGYNKKGKKQNRTVRWEVQYRVYGSGSGWTSKTGSYTLQNINGLGFTERVTLSSPGLVEIRCRRTNEQGENNSRDNMYWQSLRGRLLSRPSSYSGVTTMAVTVETGGKLAAQSDRRVNVVATRVYDYGTSRSISGALYHIGNELGLAMDHEAIDALESIYWAPNSEFFDFATGDSVSALEMMQKVTNAGKSYFLLTDGLASVDREGIKPWTGIISPQEMTDPLQTAFIAPSSDDYDGVDVTYINGTTWAEETVQCRTSDNPTPVKIEDYTLDGVVDQDRAYQIGMRRLMKYRQQRLTHTTTTEMDALCYNVGDRIVFTDDIPGSKTVSALVDDMSTAGGMTTFTVSEQLDWSFPNPHVLIRYQDGTASGLMAATRIGDYQVLVPEQAEFNSIILNDPSIEPPRLIFCDSARVGYNAIISEIAPQSDGTCQVTAKEYRDSFYDYDNATYPGNVA
ncbi:host specificity factor TipJ family phage tail protein [Citrobacter koseri]|uniref:host specificity factor TipJ family phage tail protein n=1 Tax=Citrobacter koseri TaxID=545 RepID=UPI0029431C6C|nr:host specificity factor TipJ family phage tail protein [Citrobacter koseri]MEB2702256.1 host specificity factor TipJ family phage tail protein [Citrobacter koseri]MEB2708598.1 host specificity factor TipJ family phage tail protein [Citrobacter koseri]MEB2771060.1 host specificity factor TipJ family phage tail protein [Citrobacter koseri]WOJ27639.1 host specificity factor TipJ family phage tail protein [Citrobacter koseri]